MKNFLNPVQVILISKVHTKFHFQGIEMRHIARQLLHLHAKTAYAAKHKSTQVSAKTLESLDNKRLIKVVGDDASNFLQGLITNDMRHFEAGAVNMYTLFLNIKGRVLFDSIIYKIPADDGFYIECDSSVGSALERHLKMYRLRRKIDIRPMDESAKVWVLFEPFKEDDAKSEAKVDWQIFPCGGPNNKSSKVIDKMTLYQDPRLSHLGLRIVADSSLQQGDISKLLGLDESSSGTKVDYQSLRYMLGIGEGAEDFPVGKALPLEINCDYLHGISFHKGCYIGQELTARTHHTGVVRKRLMPLILEGSSGDLSYDEQIVDENGKVVGKFRSRKGLHGLGLMRITEALNARSTSVKSTPLSVVRPSWWAQESPTHEIVTHQQ